MKITQEVYHKLKYFTPIKNSKKQCKAFRLTANGMNTGVFKEIPAHIENPLDEEMINFLENNEEVNANNNGNININQINEDDANHAERQILNMENEIQNQDGNIDGVVQREENNGDAHINIDED